MPDIPTKIDDLICFALYSTNNAMNRAYKPHLSKLGLTYPQYITLTALWEKDGVTVGELCDRLMIETSTLTPLLKRLETQGNVERRRSESDERCVFVHLTKTGKALKKKAPPITACIIEATGKSTSMLDDLVALVTEARDNLLKSQRETRH